MKNEAKTSLDDTLKHSTKSDHQSDSVQADTKYQRSTTP